MNKLRPCPFCGQPVEMSKSPWRDTWCVGCRCGAKGAATCTETEAAAAWNHRSPDEALSRLLSAAREIRDIEREGGGSMDRADEYRERWEAAVPALCEALEGLLEHGTPGTRVAAKDALAKVRGVEA